MTANIKPLLPLSSLDLMLGSTKASFFIILGLLTAFMLNPSTLASPMDSFCLIPEYRHSQVISLLDCPVSSSAHNTAVFGDTISPL